MQSEFPPESNNFTPDNASFQTTNNLRGEPYWSVATGYANWFASLIFSIIVPLVLIGVYGLFDRSLFKDMMAQKETSTLMILMLVGTFLGQVVSVALSWLIVTANGKRDFWATLGWGWVEKFKIQHAVGFAVVMVGISVAIEKVLPHQETSMERFLKFGLPVRLTLALVATIGAPITEELIYRGVLFGAIERWQSQKIAIAVVTLLFWGVHVAQYFQSIAILVAVLILSLSLTLLRAYTGKLLPCIVVHTIFNGIQGLAIVFYPPTQNASSEPAAQPALAQGVKFLTEQLAGFFQ